ncbi:MAG: family hydrolase, partial [Acidimicrobiales bacterium]|nr:family hydrolase [Acidimicrobiales bacterium]
MDCAFCRIITGDLPAHVVLDDETCLGFLDVRPVFPGHVLLVPKAHHETLVDLPPELVEPLFANARRLAAAVPAAMGAAGTFVAMNNKVSQSVPHLHVHVVPRKRKDGLRGFMWPRHPYASPEAM